MAGDARIEPCGGCLDGTYVSYPLVDVPAGVPVAAEGEPPAALREIGARNAWRLYRCARCEALWWRSADDRMAAVSSRARAAAQRWTERASTLESALLERLREIGSTVPPEAAAREARLVFPCALRMRDGSTHERALVHVTAAPPLADGVYLVADDVEDVQPSPYALSLEIRRAGYAAPERRMDWYPLVVQDHGGKRWVTRAEDPFLEAGPFRGPDFTLAGAQHRWEKEARAESLLRDDAVPQVYVDMTPALQAFFSREG